jgi:1-aminocyclopropane-1-carboxylate deaminase/D-cysteine desulfhydrase-like pyridoxal-dependent ACC family enzyme
VVAVRVVPRVVANHARVRRLAGETARLIEGTTRSTIPRPSRDAVRIEHEFYGGAYGRETPTGAEIATQCLAQTGIAIDPTYSAKALAAAVAIASREGGTTLFWLSFDGRWLADARHR